MSDGTTATKGTGVRAKIGLYPLFLVGGLVVVFVAGYYVYVYYAGELFQQASVLPPYLFLTLALVGGAASFFSPCSIAITPSFLAYFAGAGNASSEDGHPRGAGQRRAIPSVILVSGILSFYVAVAVLIGWIGALVYTRVLRF